MTRGPMPCQRRRDELTPEQEFIAWLLATLMVLPIFLLPLMLEGGS